MSDAGLDLELVVSGDSAVTIPAEDLARLPVVPGQRVRVRVEQVPSEPRRSQLGALVKPGRPVVTLDDFDAVSDSMWRERLRRRGGVGGHARFSLVLHRAGDALGGSRRRVRWRRGSRRSVGTAAVSLIELVHVTEKRSDSLDAETLKELLGLIDDPSSPIEVLPLSTTVVRETAAVPRAIVRDPFDRTIVATARASGCRLVARDSLLTRSFPELCLW